MSSSITPQQAMGLRAAGYFFFLIAFLSSFGWIGAMQKYYVIEHRWTAVSATVYSLREESREVKPSSARQRNFQVFWMEFLVVLDLPQDQCPGSMVPLTTSEPQCTGTVKTPEVKSRANALEWVGRHPQGSKIVVRYDSQSGEMAIGGESIFNIYPWDKIGFTVAILIVGVLMVRAGKRRSARPEYPPGTPEVREE